MLGRLKMSVNDSTAKFKEYSRKIFGSPRLFYRLFGSFMATLFGRPRYSEKVIVDATRILVGNFDPSPESKKWKRDLFFSPGDQCRTFETTSPAPNNCPSANKS
jgi:hypothetical protein